jgi:hypothetical protein
MIPFSGRRSGLSSKFTSCNFYPLIGSFAETGSKGEKSLGLALVIGYYYLGELNCFKFEVRLNFDWKSWIWNWEYTVSLNVELFNILSIESPFNAIFSSLNLLSLRCFPCIMFGDRLTILLRTVVSLYWRTCLIRASLLILSALAIY